MNNLRMLLWGFLALSLFWNYQFYLQDHPPVVTPAPVAKPAESVAAAPPANPDLSPSTPSATSSNPTAAPNANTAADTALVNPPAATPRVSIDTDVLHLEVNLTGAVIQKATLTTYTQSRDNSQPITLIDSDNADSFGALQSGYKSTAGWSIGPNTRYTSEASEYRLADGQNTLSVPFNTDDGQGHKLTRTLVLTRGHYAIQINDTLTNTATTAWPVASYADVIKRWQKNERSMLNPSTYAFRGPAVYDGNKIQKLDVETVNAEQLPKTDVSGGWVAAMQHHFVVVVVPALQQSNHYEYVVKNHDYRLGYSASQTVGVNPNESQQFSTTVFVGPKLQEQLAALGQKLEYTADYGRLTIIAEPLFWLLSMVHKLAINWGLTIIIVTMLIKAAFYPLAQASGRSMAKVRLAQPRLKAIQERYKDNREELGRAMMEFYKREKINPLGGCLPTLLQMPVFIAFYWVLMESVEMRQAPFIFWLQDLSTKDPYYILPMIMAGAMFFQYKLNPTSPDPVQAKVFMFMPFVMSAMMSALPSGLVLYWVVNTLLTILQQVHINKVVAAEEHKLRT
jgi:YidC/Oxa1 family membrane protein insertase